MDRGENMQIKKNKRLLRMKPKTFILNYLIPFIMRDAGNGFVMDTWKRKAPKECGGKEYVYDGIERRAPACGTVACIGGSIQCLTGLNFRFAPNKTAKLLGITRDEAYGLFFDWGNLEGG